MILTRARRTEDQKDDKSRYIEKPFTNAEMKILKWSLQHCLDNFEKQYEYEKDNYILRESYNQTKIIYQILPKNFYCLLKKCQLFISSRESIIFLVIADFIITFKKIIF